MADYNIQKMLDDGYSSQEIATALSSKHKVDYGKMKGDGYSDDDIIEAFNKATIKQEPTRAEPGSISYAFQGAGALPESFIRMGAGFAGTAAGGLASIPKQAYDLATSGVDKAAQTAREWGGAAPTFIEEKIPKLFAPTKDFEKTIGDVFEAGKKGTGAHLRRMQELTDKGRLTEQERYQRANAAEAVGEVGFDTVLAAMFGKSLGRSASRTRDRLDARAAERDAQAAKENLSPAEKAADTALAEYQKELIKLENEMGVYPDQARAPQYGLGKQRMEVPPDATRRGLPPDAERSGRTVYDRQLEIDQTTPPTGAPFTVQAAREIPQEIAVRQGELFPEKPQQPRLPPEQFELPFDRDPRVLEAEKRANLPEPDYWEFQRQAEQRRASDYNKALEQRVAQSVQERVVPSVEEAFRRQEETRMDQQRMDQTRRQLFEESTKEPPEPSQGGPSAVQRLSRVPLRQRGMVNPEVFGEKLASLFATSQKNINKANADLAAKGQKDADVLNLATGEKRSYREWLSSVGGKIQDIPGSFYNKTEQLFQSPSAIVRSTNNPFVKFVQERAHNAYKMAELQADLIKEGVRVQIGRMGSAKKIVDPNSIKERFKWANMGFKGLRESAAIINEYGGKYMPTREQLLKQGYSQKAVDGTLLMNKKLSELWDWYNQKRIEAGKAPIEGLPFYYMRYAGEGNWMARVKDAKGETIWHHKYKTKAEATEWSEKMAKEIKDKQGIETSSLQTHLGDSTSRSGKNTVGHGVFEDIVQALDAKDPRRKVLDGIYKELISKQAAGGHTIKRRNIPGAELQGKDIYKAFDEYVDQIKVAGRNLELSALQKEIRLSKEMPANSNVGKWAMDYLDTLRGERQGGKLINEFEGWVDHAMSNLGMERFNSIGTSRATLNTTKKLFFNLQLMLANAVFGIASGVQSTMASIPVLRLYKNNNPNITASPTGSMFKAYTDLAAPTKDQRKFLEFMALRGEKDPMLIHELSSFGKEQFNKWILDRIGQRWFPVKAEGFSRAHAGMTAYNLLYDSGMRGKELYNEAARLSRDIMVDYNITDRPRWVNQMGIVGEAAGPLSTYYMWYLSTLGTMLKEVGTGIKRGEPSRIAPLAQFMLMGTLFSGIIGMPLFKELDNLHALLRGLPWLKEIPIFKENALSPSQLVLENMPDWAVFGPIDSLWSAANEEGLRLMSGVQAPEVHLPGQGGGMFPGIQMAGNLLSAATTAVKDVLGGDVTEAEKRKAARALLPRMGDAIYDVLDSENWMNPDIVPMGGRGFGGVERESNWSKAASVVGAGTLKEQREKLILGEFKDRRPELQEKQNRAVDLIADFVTSKKEQDPERLDRLIEKAIELGVNPNTLNRRVNETIKQRMQTESERKVGRGLTPTQQRLLEELEGGASAR